MVEEGIRVLDVGCGVVPENCLGDVGVDIRRGACDVLADAHNLPFKDGVFGKVYLKWVLEHLGKPDKCLKEVSRVSQEGASVDIILPTEAYTNTAKCQLFRAVFGFPWGVLKALQWLLAPKALSGHKSIISIKFLETYLGSMKVTTFGDHPWFWGRKGKFLKRLGLRCPSRNSRRVIGKLKNG